MQDQSRREETNSGWGRRLGEIKDADGYDYGNVEDLVYADFLRTEGI